MPENWASVNLEPQMQDIHGGGGGKLIGAGDRRLRLLNHHAVKCPRCDSLNTKFCYYNNYNLSQPRHFCKSCRRYWTKGGVLRSVPVGGGCRKAKRSKPKSNASSADDALGDCKSTAQTSSSESSSLTTTASAAAVPTSASAEEGSAPIYTTADSAVVFKIPDASFSNVSPEENSNLDRRPLDNHSPSDGQIFSAEIGSFVGLMTSSEEMMMELDADTTSYPPENLISEKSSTGKVDELKIEHVSKDELAAALEWGSCGGDQELYDLTAAVDPAYWTDNDHSLSYAP